MKYQCVYTEVNLNNKNKKNRAKISHAFVAITLFPLLSWTRYPLLLCEGTINMGNNYTGEKELNYVKWWELQRNTRELDAKLQLNFNSI